jgi:hypothetical protein
MVSWRMSASSAQRKAVTLLVVSWPPVMLQRKTRAMMPRSIVVKTDVARGSHVRAVCYRHPVGYCRSPGNTTPADSIGRSRISSWSTMVVSIKAHGFGGGRSVVVVSLRRHGRWVKLSAPHFAQTR